MELVNLVFRFFGRLIGFILFFAIVGGSAYIVQPTWQVNWQAGIILISIAIGFAWFTYNKLIGNFEQDLAVLVRFLQVRGVGSLDGFKQTLAAYVDARATSPFIQEYEVVEWHDIEVNERVKRRLASGRLNILLGQYDGRAQFCDLAGDIGKLYISAPDRTGKTQMIKQIIASILLTHPLAKKEIDFVFVDITRDLAIFRPLGKYTHDMKEAHAILQGLGKELDRRNTLREKYTHADWWHEIPGQERPKMTVLVIDEAIQVLKEGGPALEKAWSNLINIGWKNGVLMITTTLYTRGDLIPTEFTALMRGKVCGNMGTKQGWINIVEVDYYEKHKEQLEGFVNQKYHFALCVRPNKPVLFRTIFVPKERLMELVQESVVNPSDWREVALTIWWNNQSNISSEELARRTREFVELHGDATTKPETIHKKSILDLLRQSVEAGIATHRGERERYGIREDVTSYGVMLERFDKFVLDGGLDKRVPSGAEMAVK